MVRALGEQREPSTLTAGAAMQLCSGRRFQWWTDGRLEFHHAV